MAWLYKKKASVDGIFLDISPFPVLRVTEEGILLYANAASKKLLLAWKTKIGRKIPESIKCLTYSSLMERQPSTFECEVQEEIHRITAVPVWEKKYVNLYGQNITQEKKIEESLLEEKEIALNAIQTKSNFLANMSHEIRTPMNGIIGIISLLIDTKLSPAQKEQVSIIKDSADTLLILINDILDYSKIEAGQINIQYDAFNMEDALRNIIKLLEVKAEEKGIELSYQTDENFPKWVNGDKTRIVQVITNLLSNSIKFTQKGSVKLTGKIKEEKKSSYKLEFLVKDTGIGISDKVKKEVFKPFQQADASTTREFGGTGLGLSISRQLSHLMGGNLYMKSTVGKGTTAYFNFLTVKVEKDFIEKKESKKEKRHIPENLKILLVDDGAINRLVAVKMLEKINISCEVAENGIEAIEKLRENPYDIILMDCLMPKLDGFEATKIIKKEWSKEKCPRIIAITANAMPEDKEKCLNAGMDDYISKPISIETLTSALEKCTPINKGVK